MHTINDFLFFLPLLILSCQSSPSFLCTSFSQSCLFSHYSTHSSLPHHPLSSLHMWFLLSHLCFFLSWSTFLHPPPPSPPPLPLGFSGRLLIAVSQYHGGRQRRCRSGGECSTRSAGSHSHVQPWHLGQVRLVHVPSRTDSPEHLSPGRWGEEECLWRERPHLRLWFGERHASLFIVRAVCMGACECMYVNQSECLSVCVCVVHAHRLKASYTLFMCVSYSYCFIPHATYEANAPVITTGESGLCL